MLRVSLLVLFFTMLVINCHGWGNHNSTFDVKFDEPSPDTAPSSKDFEKILKDVVGQGATTTQQTLADFKAKSGDAAPKKSNPIPPRKKESCETVVGQVPWDALQTALAELETACKAQIQLIEKTGKSKGDKGPPSLRSFFVNFVDKEDAAAKQWNKWKSSYYLVLRSQPHCVTDLSNKRNELIKNKAPSYGQLVEVSYNQTASNGETGTRLSSSHFSISRKEANYLLRQRHEARALSNPQKNSNKKLFQLAEKTTVVKSLARKNKPKQNPPTLPKASEEQITKFIKSFQDKKLMEELSKNVTIEVEGFTELPVPFVVKAAANVDSADTTKSRKGKEQGRLQAMFLETRMKTRTQAPQHRGNCDIQCTNMFNALAQATGVRAHEVTPAQTTSSINGILSAAERVLLGDALFYDLRKANLVMNRIGSELIMTWPKSLTFVRALMHKLQQVINYVEQHDPIGGAANYYSRAMRPQGINPPVYDSNLYNQLCFYGHIGNLADQNAYDTVRQHGNIRESLSVMYTLLNGNGGGQGWWTMIGRIAALSHTAAHRLALVGFGVDFNFLINHEQANLAHPCLENSSPLYRYSMPPAGWVMMKLSCANTWQWGAAMSNVKLTEWHASNRVLPPLSQREIRNLYHGYAAHVQAQAATQFQTLLIDHDLNLYGLRVPWASGGDRVLPNNNMPAGAAVTFAQWSNDAAQRIWAAPSGSADMYFQFASALTITNDEKVLLRGIMGAWIELARDHSTHEVLMAIEPHGINYMTHYTANHEWRYVWRDMLNPGAPFTDQQTSNGVDNFEDHALGQGYAYLDAAAVVTVDYPHALVETQEYIDARALQVWFLNSLAAAPAVPAMTMPNFGWQALDIPAAIVPRVDRDAYVKAFGVIAEANQAAKIFIFEHGGAARVRIRPDAMSVANAGALTYAQHFEFTPEDINAVMADNTWLVVDLAASGLAAVGANCFSLTMVQAGANRNVRFCCNNNAALQRIRHDLIFARDNQNGVTDVQYVQGLQDAYFQAFGAERNVMINVVTNAEKNHARTWICNQAVIAVAPLNTYMNLVRDVALCGVAFNAGNNDHVAKDGCFLRILEAHRDPCTWSGAGPANCFRSFGWWRELYNLAAICMYTHEQGGNTFGQNAYQLAAYDAFDNPGTLGSPNLPLMPRYEGVVFSGGVGAATVHRYMTAALGSSFDINNWFSFSRSIEVSWWFQDFRRGALPADEPTYMLVLLRAPHGRDIGNVGVYDDNEQEVFVPPARYRILSRRMFNAYNVADPKGPSGMIFIEYVCSIRNGACNALDES